MRDLIINSLFKEALQYQHNNQPHPGVSSPDERNILQVIISEAFVYLYEELRIWDGIYKEVDSYSKK